MGDFTRGSRGSWTDDAAAWLQDAIKAHPEMTKPELRKWCSANYPYAQRTGWAYKAWLKALRAHFNPQAVRPIRSGKTQPSATERSRVGASWATGASAVTPILKAIRRACDKAGGQNAWAEAHGLQKSMVSRVLSGERGNGPAGVPDSILAAVGYERVVTYRMIPTKKQLDIMRMALGICRGCDDGWKNSFSAAHGSRPHEDCEALTAGGLMNRSDGIDTDAYSVTEAGRSALAETNKR